MEELIHAMLIKLNQAGHTFELVPDLLQTPVRELPVEGLQSGNSTRALATNFYGHARGTDQWLISRLAIDSGLKRKRMLESDDDRTYLAAKTGVDIARVNFGNDMGPAGARAGNDRAGMRPNTALRRAHQPPCLPANQSPDAQRR